VLVSHVVHDHHPKIFSSSCVAFVAEEGNENKQSPGEGKRVSVHDESAKKEEDSRIAGMTKSEI
jgi:uncharacterized membrane-anchored protein